MGSRQQESVFKGRVKRLLREQEDMGQVADSAVQCCVAAVEALVRDLGCQLRAQVQAQDEGGGVAVVTPVELKRAVLADPTLAFLRGAVERIDERAATGHKRRRAAPAAGASKKPAKMKATTAKTPPPPPAARAKPAEAIAVEEDDDYDESDSE